MPPETAATAATRGARHRVLLVESDPGDAELVQIWLRRARETRYEIWHVETLGDAEGCLAKAPFDLALVDLTLPDASGPWAFHALRVRWPDLPVIVFSSFADAEVGARLLEEGAQDHLVKGQMSGDTLIRSMRHGIERGRLERELREARVEAGNAAQRRSELVAEIGQELRTPLHTVLGMADLLLETELTREQEGYVRSFLRASESLIARIDGLLGAGPSPSVGDPGPGPGSGEPAAVAGDGALRILVADDAVETRERAAERLRRAGNHVDAVSDGRAAVERYAEGEYDLILMDVQMPGMDGLEATRRIRRIEADAGRPATPILAITGLTSADDVRACLEAGCDAHLPKPVAPDALLDAVACHAPKHHGRLLRVDGGRIEAIDLFLHERHNDLAGIRLALETDDLDAVRAVGVELEGAARREGFGELAVLGCELQRAACAGDRPAVERGVADLTDYLREVKIIVG